MIRILRRWMTRLDCSPSLLLINKVSEQIQLGLLPDFLWMDSNEPLVKPHSDEALPGDETRETERERGALSIS